MEELKKLEVRDVKSFEFKTENKRKYHAKRVYQWNESLGKPRGFFIHACLSKFDIHLLKLVKVTIEEYKNEKTKYSWKKKYMPEEEN